MPYTVQNLIEDVDTTLHTGGTIQTQDFYGALDRGRRNMLMKIAPPEMIRQAYLEQALYDQVDKYAVPIEMKYSDVISINMLSGYRNVDTMAHPLEQVYLRRFGQKRPGSENIFSVNRINGVKYMSIYHPRGLRRCQHRVIHNADSLSDNGTWNVGGNLVNLQLDKLNHITGHGSLRFDFNNSGTTGFLENLSLTTVDLHEFIETGAIFTWFDINNWQTITSVKITLFTSPGGTYEFTVNQPHDNNQFLNGWNLLKFLFEGVGNPNPREITGVRLDFTTTGQESFNNRIDNIVVRKGVVYEMYYNSAWCIIDPITKAWKQRATSAADEFPFEEDTYEILMLETALVVMKGAYNNAAGAQADVNDIKSDLKEKYEQYKIDHKSEAIEPMQTTYIFGNMYDGLTDEPMPGHYGSPTNDGDNYGGQ